MIYDFLMTIDVKPVVELSFMPKALVTCGGGTDPETGVTQPDCVYSHSSYGSDGPGHGAYKGLMMPPDNYEDWSVYRCCLLCIIYIPAIDMYIHASD